MPPAHNFGRLIFRNARSSGILISQLGSGQYDHIGFFGAGDVTSPIEVGTYQDTTWIVDASGLAGSPMAQSKKLTNCKWIDNTHVRISGLPKGPYNKLITQVNVFKSAALHTYPSFPQQSSGTLMIEYQASGTSRVNMYNAKLYAYDKTGLVTDPAPDVTVVGFEINASGQWYTGQSGVWVTMAGQNSPLFFVNHSSANHWKAEHKHLWVAALSVRANSVGVLDDWNFAFQVQFA